MGDVHNQFTGNATYVIQARDIIGDVVFQTVTESPQGRAATDLAKVVRAQWRDEAVTRGLAGAGALAVRWVADWSVADHQENVRVTAAGGLGDLANAFRTMPDQRLVIIGAPGSGKTSLAILLTLELLRDRTAGQPVPVVLLASSWDPGREHFDAWLGRRITEEYLEQGDDLTRDRIRELVRDREVIPVLDGIDEMPELLLEEALAALNRALGDGSPVILTCRAAEYANAVADKSVLGAAAVIRAQPVAAEPAAGYLRRTSQPRLLARWEPVLSELVGNPAGPVAKTFESPLMLWLARTVYTTSANDPVELLDAQRFPDVSTIERRLLDALVPAVFRTGPRSPHQPRPARDWGPRRAQRWLAFLAAHLMRSRSREIEWWNLSQFTLLDLAVLAGIGFGLTPAITLLAGWYPTPDAVQSFELAIGADVAFKTGAMAQAVILVLRLRTSDLPRRPRLSGRLPGMVVLLAIVVTVGSFLSPGQSIVVIGDGVAAILVVGLTVPVQSAQALGPRALLRGEQATTALTVLLISPLIGGLTAWLMPTDGWAAASGIALIGGLGVAVVAVTVSPWGRWVLTKAALAVMRRFPLSALTFLEDAHRVGVLRQVGGVYQFRHSLLRERLASVWNDKDFAPAVGRYEPDELRLDGSGTMLGGWKFALLMVGGSVVVIAKLGAWADLQMWLSVGATWGGVALISWVPVRLVSRKAKLRLTSEVIEAGFGRRTVTFRWTDVEEVAVRKFEPSSGRSGGFMLHLRPAPSVELDTWVRVNSTGWVAVYSLGAKGVVPAQLDAALTRFAGDRWKRFE
ncbi:NACHT domain-containing protein [Actinocrispum wychmicini]|uniref:NACHT domain-containing protein n=1 Tax=Actinocrispum wychmicini TaxID=1213861 RepID=UPI0014055A26|nr:NACHT domain-containing protein [Actinocrispum wychmicini]